MTENHCGYFVYVCSVQRRAAILWGPGVLTPDFLAVGGGPNMDGPPLFNFFRAAIRGLLLLPLPRGHLSLCVKSEHL